MVWVDGGGEKSSVVEPVMASDKAKVLEQLEEWEKCTSDDAILLRLKTATVLTNTLKADAQQLFDRLRTAVRSESTKASQQQAVDNQLIGELAKKVGGSQKALASELAFLLLQFDSARGPKHHVATNKNPTSDTDGGPWTPIFKKIFDTAGVSLDDPANLVRIPGHHGPHPEEYHTYVHKKIVEAVGKCEDQKKCCNDLKKQLVELGKEASKCGTWLNKLLTTKRQ
ncbi:MAG: AHH domain-containing protein [Planctomycetota bacterium]|nr:AHH domain-containing protein [Planctomycetota bacterium]